MSFDKISFARLLVVVVFAIAVGLIVQRPSKKKSVINQAINYLSRPHTHRDVFKPINTALAWNGSYMQQHPEIWRYQLTEKEQASIEETVLQFEALNISTEDLAPGNFRFSKEMLNHFAEWRKQLGPQGRGFQVISGVPVARWTLHQCEIFFWAFGKYMGLPGAQDKAGALLHHVIDAGSANTIPRPYRMKVDIDYHCDGSDVVGLLCLHHAKSGGASRIISTVSVYNKLLEMYPGSEGQSMIRKLFDKVLLYTRKTFGVASYLPVRPLRMDSLGTLRTYWNQGFYTKFYRYEVNQSLTPAGEADPVLVKALDSYDAILAQDMKYSHHTLVAEASGAELTNGAMLEGDNGFELGLEMNLQPGDIQLASNHFILHARTSFEDYTNEELSAAGAPASSENGGIIGHMGRRDLLRLWISHPDAELPWGLYIDKQIDKLRVLAGLLEAVIFYR